MNKLEEIKELTSDLKHYKYCLGAFNTGDVVIDYWEGYERKYAGAHKQIKVEDEIQKFAYRWYVDKISELEQRRATLFSSLTPDEQLAILDR